MPKKPLAVHPGISRAGTGELRTKSNTATRSRGVRQTNWQKITSTELLQLPKMPFRVLQIPASDHTRSSRHIASRQPRATMPRTVATCVTTYHNVLPYPQVVQPRDREGGRHLLPRQVRTRFKSLSLSGQSAKVRGEGVLPQLRYDQFHSNFTNSRVQSFHPKSSYRRYRLRKRTPLLAVSRRPASTTGGTSCSMNKLLSDECELLPRPGTMDIKPGRQCIPLLGGSLLRHPSGCSMTAYAARAGSSEWYARNGWRSFVLRRASTREK